MIVKDCWRGSLTLPGSVTVFSPKTPPTYRRIYLLSENKKMFLDLEMHEYRVDNKISIDKEFLIQDPDGYLLRFNN